ncbi:efflux RND transporter periplasmic adaptor subunit [Sphingobacterium spiritivorum]|uniref:efflux RND transporter periplasmic adaptor subunit n=1 Tax=Sphingobacterium spiritivorum TaxID=258 RepID=UPI003DA562BB
MKKNYIVKGKQYVDPVCNAPAQLWYGRNRIPSSGKNKALINIKFARVTLPVAVSGLIMLLLSIAFTSCRPEQKKEHHDVGKITIDSSLSVLLQPSNKQVVGNMAVVNAIYQSKIMLAEVQGIVNYDNRAETGVASRVGGRLEKINIKYNYQPVRKGQLLFEIYAPDLAAAQQDLLYLSQNGEEQLLSQARQRLLLLGMTEQDIQQVLLSKRVNYRIPVYSPTDGFILEKSVANAIAASAPSVSSAGSGGGMSEMEGMSTGSESTTPSAAAVQSTSVMLREGQYVSAGQSLFTIYKSDQLLAEFALKPMLAAYVNKGYKLGFYKTADREGSFQTSTIGLIQPMIKSGENFTLARVYLAKGKFKAGEILTAKIPVRIEGSYWLPASAILSAGAQSIVFKKENNVFKPVSVKTGLRIEGMIQIKQDISLWEFARDAAYMVDSESFIKAGEED